MYHEIDAWLSECESLLVQAWAPISSTQIPSAQLSERSKGSLVKLEYMMTCLYGERRRAASLIVSSHGGFFTGNFPCRSRSDDARPHRS